MEYQKKQMEHKGVSMSRKKKATKKEAESINKHYVGDATVAATTAEEEWRRGHENKNNVIINHNVSNMEGINSSVTMGVGHDHNHNHNHNHDGDHDMYEDWRAWWRPVMLVDEQMSWGSVWYSYLDVDENCHAFYSDVVEDDLWDLKSIQHIPQ